MKTWKPTTAGILTIIAGILGIIGGILVITGGSFVGALFGFGLGGGVVAFGVVTLILGIVALIGGVQAIQRKQWGFALAGAIISIFLFWILGILATIFVILGRNEFS